MIVLPLAYFPPIPWFTAIYDQQEMLLEYCQHYRKQQISNRMYIKAVNGNLGLSIPVQRRGSRMPIKDKKISYQENWPKQHWISLCSAYRNSPYFIYYESDLEKLYTQRPVYLYEFLEEALRFCIKNLRLEITWVASSEYQESDYYGKEDLRSAFGPKPGDLPDWFEPTYYPQVFDGFQAGLSILDLLSNEGPNSMHIIKAGKKSSPQSHL